MKYTQLSNHITGANIIALSDAEVIGIAYDSREVKPGFVFVAMEGTITDGHHFVRKAVENGAVGIIAEREVVLPEGIGCILVNDGRKAMGEASAALYDFPTRKLKLIGVTGTSGKTTTTHLIHSIISASGHKAGLIGTIDAKIGKESISTKHTTPESVDLQEMFAQMVDAGVYACAIEVSSHGLFQGRVIGCEFNCGVFTNIARDHLDFHKTTEAYLDAKLMLFRDYPKSSDKEFVSVVNIDDHAGDVFLSVAKGPKISFGIKNSADVCAKDLIISDRSCQFNLIYKGESFPISLAIGGDFNVYNSLAAASAAIAIGLDMDAIITGLADALSVPGRFEAIDCGQDYGVLVDYAHTPDELENVLNSARKITKNHLIAVFGCGGDRDKGKRPIMGGIGVDYADTLIVTSDNPRTENPDKIIEDILAGIDHPKKHKVTIRTKPLKNAIAKAISMAEPGDVIVIAGKGHEDYQIFANETIHFDDREIAREILKCSL